MDVNLTIYLKISVRKYFCFYYYNSIKLFLFVVLTTQIRYLYLTKSFVCIFPKITTLFKAILLLSYILQANSTLF